MAVRSESWIDLSLSCDVVCNSKGRPLDGQHRNQEQASRSKYSKQNNQHRTEDTGGSQSNSHSRRQHYRHSISGINEHLLIRLRQQSYLERSNSNLSSSVELDSSLLAPTSGSRSRLSTTVSDFHIEEDSDRWPRHQRQVRAPNESVALKSFRQRLQDRSRARVGRRFAGRSWSSLSEQLGGKLSHLSHSWKQLLLSYGRTNRGPGRTGKGSSRVADESGELEMLATGLLRDCDEGYDEECRRMESIRRQLTAHWVEKQWQSHAILLPSCNAAKQAQQASDQETGPRERHLVSNTQLKQANDPQPLALAKSSRRTSTDTSTSSATLVDHQSCTIGNPCESAESDLANQLAAKGDLEAAPSALMAPIPAIRRNLINNQLNQGSSKLKAAPGHHQADPSSSGAKVSTEHQCPLIKASDLQMLNTNYNLHQQQHSATSDYWSTATSAATRSDSQAELNLTIHSKNANYPHKQQQQQQQQPENPTLIDHNQGQFQPMMFSDQRTSIGPTLGSADDYYLDVANHQAAPSMRPSSGFDSSHRARQHGQLVAGLNSPRTSSLSISPQLAGLLDYSDDYRCFQMTPMNPEPGLLAGHRPDHQAQLFFRSGSSHGSATNHQQAFVSGSMMPYIPSQYQNEQQLQADEDYDDYAVPSDESCCRLDRSQVELVQLIGEGQKGYVFLGKLQSKDGRRMIDVAIKTLKYETEQLIDRLMGEASMMRQLEHPHIIRFIGVCPETPALIAMELAPYGEIKQYLKLNQQSVRVSQVVLFTFQISTALSYLESKHYVHRDVAARNVLVCSPQCVKLADFGLTRNLQSNLQLIDHTGTQYLQNQQQQRRNELSKLQQQHLDLMNQLIDPDDKSHYVAAPRVKLPVRWLAPESLVFRRFTSASDVWMFAVCTWELFQYGLVRPWPQLRNNQVLIAIESGQRLPRPHSCPKRLYQLMLQCWSYAPVQRPKFREIKQCIWSIYLNERTKEQQIFIIDQQQQQFRSTSSIHSPSPTSFASSHLVAKQASRQAPRHQTPTDPSTRSTDGSPRNHYNSAATTITTNEESSPGSSLGSLARRQQLGRFERSTRTHLLQKQRSQGTIGDEEFALANNGFKMSNQPAWPGHKHRRQGLDDGVLLGPARRQTMATMWPASHQLDSDEDEDEQETKHVSCKRPLAGTIKQDSAYEGFWPNMGLDPVAGERGAGAQPPASALPAWPTPTSLSNLEKSSSRLTPRPKPPQEVQATGRPISWRQSASSGPQTDTSRASKRPMHEASAGVRSALLEQQQKHRTNKDSNRADQDQLGQVLQDLQITPMKARLRSPPRGTVRVFERQADQKGQPRPLEHNRLDSPAQMRSSVRLQRDMAVDHSRDGKGNNEDSAGANQQQLQLHQRLLGRIKSRWRQSEPSAVTVTAKQPTRTTSNSGHQPLEPTTTQARVESVDQSLRILESLMSNNNSAGDEHQAPSRLSTLERRMRRKPHH